MSSNMSAPSPSARDAKVPVRGSPDEVVVELRAIGPAAKTRGADQDGAGQRLGRVGSVEYVNAQGGRGAFAEQFDSPAVQALRECLATLDRDHHVVETRQAGCLETIKRYLTCTTKDT